MHFNSQCTIRTTRPKNVPYLTNNQNMTLSALTQKGHQFANVITTTSDLALRINVLF